MSDTPPSGPPRRGRPGPGTPDQRRPVKGWSVVGGAVLGFVGTWLLFALVLMAIYSASGDSTSTWQDVIGFAALLALPVMGLALMISPRTRHAGAGLLMGIAIGSMVGAGICATVLGLGR